MKLNFTGFNLHTILKPCPFCGSTNTGISDDSHTHDSCWVAVAVYCNSCGITGPSADADCRNDKSYRHGEYEARKKWNTRV